MYPGFETEKPDNYDELKQAFESRVTTEKPSGLLKGPEKNEFYDDASEEFGIYLFENVHDGENSIEDCLYVLADSDKYSFTKDMRTIASRALNEVIKRATESYSPTLEKTTNIGGETEFAEKAIEHFQEANPDLKADEMNRLIDKTVEVEGDSYQEFMTEYGEAEVLNEFESFSQEILRETFGSGVKFPLVKGIGYRKIAQTDPDGPISQFDSEEVTREEFAEIMANHVRSNGLKIGRPQLDSWTTDPETANFFADSISDRHKGVYIEQSVDIENIAFSCITTPSLLGESEFRLSDGTEQFNSDQYHIRAGNEEDNLFEHEALRLYNGLESQGFF